MNRSYPQDNGYGGYQPNGHPPASNGHPYAGNAAGLRPTPSQRVPTLSRSLDLDLQSAVNIFLAGIDRADLAANQKSRLRCMLPKLLDPAVDDRYLNGYNYLLQTLGPRLNDEQFNLMLEHVRPDVQRDAASPDSLGTALDMLDRRIFSGIAYLNRQWATQGAALANAHLQLKDWIAEQQANTNSIYYCYGEGQ
jgi:hypothetical protein